MYRITIDIPEQFLPILDEIVVQMQAGTREMCIKSMIKGNLIQAQSNKDLMPQFQQRSMYYASLWP
jgi:hypothetical protein